RRGPPPRLGICYDAGPRAAVRARLRPGDATVPLRRERPVRLAPKCRGRDHRPVPDRPAGASHVGADRRRRARPEGERADAGRLRVGAACWAREAPVGIEPTNRGFADLCLTTWLRRRGPRKSLEHYAFSTHLDGALLPGDIEVSAGSGHNFVERLVTVRLPGFGVAHFVHVPVGVRKASRVILDPTK